MNGDDRRIAAARKVLDQTAARLQRQLDTEASRAEARIAAAATETTTIRSPSKPGSVTISESGRGRGRRRKLHTFVRSFPEAETVIERWRAETPVSRKQVFAAPADTPNRPMPISAYRAQRDLALGIDTDKPLQPGTAVHLGGGFHIRVDTLAAILEAHYRSGRQDLDLDDVKRLRPQLDPRISRLGALGVDERRNAEAALYTEIVRRCTSIIP